MMFFFSIYTFINCYTRKEVRLTPYFFYILTFLVFSLYSTAQKSKISSNPIPTQNSQNTVDSLSQPGWLGKEPIVIIGNWDDAPMFQRRRGGNTVFQEEEYAKGHTEEAVQKLKEAGITMAIIHFYKGFGIEAEKEQMEDAKKLASLYHKYGIKVGVYIASTVSFETMLIENPEAEEWFVPDYLGQPVIYHSQTFRKRVYFMHPGYINYIKEVVRIAIEDLKVDLIHFDNTSMQAQRPIFFHPMAIEDFRTFLKSKYSDEMLKKRFGFSDVRYVEPPNYNLPLSKIEDPLFQEWTDFRCQQLANYYQEMKKYIRNLNPEVAIDNNPHSGISGVNSKWLQGVNYPRLLPYTDFVWVEERNEARVSEDSILLSKIRTYKAANILNNRIFTYTGTNPYSPGSELQMAEAMAYNRQCLGMVGGDLAGYQMPAKEKEYVKFYHKNFNYYRDIDNIADVAILHSFASMAFNNDQPYQSTYLYEQSLIQAKIPFYF